MKREYEWRSSGREGETYEVWYLEDGAPIHLAETPNFIGDDKKRVQKSDQGFVIICAEVPLCIAKRRERWTAAQLAGLPIDAPGLNFLRPYMKSFANCKIATTRSTREHIRIMDLVDFCRKAALRRRITAAHYT